MADVPVVRGVTLSGVLGKGGAGEVYAGIDDGSGHRVAVKVLFPGVDRTDSAATGFSVESESLVRLFRAGRLADGRACLVMEFCPGGTLGDQVTARGRFDLGEVVSVLAGVADGLSALHAAGLVHGDLSPSNVLFTGLGRPLLGDLEAVCRDGEPLPDQLSDGYADEAASFASAAVDVYGLGALGWFMLTGEAPGPSASRLPLPALRTDTPSALAELLVSCLAPGERRPSLPEFTSRLQGLAIAPEPVRLRPVAPVADRAAVITARQRPAAPALAAADRIRARAQHRQLMEQRRATRRRRATAVVSLALLVGLLVGLRVLTEPAAVAAPPAAAPAPTATAAAVPRDPGDALVELNRRRVQAFIDRDAHALATVSAPGSPALRRDRATLAAYRSQGLRPDGLRVQVVWTTVQRRSATSATVLLSTAVSAHRLTRDDGTLARQVPRGDITTTTVQLVQVAGEWRVQEVRAPG